MAFEIIKTYWKEALAYRAEYYLSLFVTPFRFLVIVMLWFFIYEANGITQIEGYDLPMLVTYFMIANIIMIFTYNNIPEQFQEEIVTGNFIVNLLKPIYFPFLWLVRMIARRGFAIFIEAIPTFLLFAIFFKDYFIMGDIMLFLLSVFLAFFISYLISMLIACIAFWFINIRSFSWLLRFMISFASGLFIPITLFPKFLENILAFLPFKYLAFVPTNIYLGKYSKDLADPFVDTVYFQFIMQIIWIVILFFIVRFVWSKGIKRFSGVGA